MPLPLTIPPPSGIIPISDHGFRVPAPPIPDGADGIQLWARIPDGQWGEFYDSADGPPFFGDLVNYKADDSAGYAPNLIVLKAVAYSGTSTVESDLTIGNYLPFATSLLSQVKYDDVAKKSDMLLTLPAWNPSLPVSGPGFPPYPTIRYFQVFDDMGFDVEENIPASRSIPITYSPTSDPPYILYVTVDDSLDNARLYVYLLDPEIGIIDISPVPGPCPCCPFCLQ